MLESARDADEGCAVKGDALIRRQLIVKSHREEEKEVRGQEAVGNAISAAQFEEEEVEVTITMSTPDDSIDELIASELHKIGKNLTSFDLSDSEFPESDTDSDPPEFPLTFSVKLRPFPQGPEESSDQPAFFSVGDAGKASSEASEVELNEEIQEVATERELLEESQAAISDVLAGSNFTLAKAKRRSQSKWAAKMIARLEKTVCKRGSRTKSISGRPCRGHAWRGWWQRRRHGPHCDGWHDTPTIPPCCRPCHGGNGVMNTCVSCNGWYEGPFACWEPCGEGAGLPHMPDNCGTMYCSKDGGTCFAKGAQIAMGFIDVLGSLLPSRGATRAAAKTAKKALKKGDTFWVAAKKGLKVLLKAKAKELARKAKRNLRKYMKREKKELKEEVMDAILEDGAEGLLAKAEAERDPDLAAIAMEIAEAVDPTGFVGLVNSFSAEGCGEVRVNEAMPEDGLSDSDECIDKNRDCGYWTSAGYCSSSSIYHPYMMGNCCASCGGR